MALSDLVAGKTYLVLGLGVTGIATANALHQAGAKVFAWDDKFQPVDVDFEVSNPVSDGFNHNVDALVMSPGIPHTFPTPHPVAAWAKEQSVPIIGDIELLMLSQPDRKFVGITGTNGKSTTTALISHILETANAPHSVGGNLGPAALGLADPGVGGWYVLEMSSYQLELLNEAKFDVSAFLNLTPDHLERHGDLAGYTEAKYRVFSNLSKEGKAVISIDQPVGQQFAQRLNALPTASISAVSIINESAKISAVNGLLSLEDRFVLDLHSLIKFPGQHNWQNFAVAYGVCAAIGLSDQQIVEGMQSFGGLAHRQEFVGSIGSIEFVNDSKGTNPEASEVALSAYNNIYWIVGGQAKAEGVQPLLHLSKRIRCAYLIGESSQRFAAEMEGHIPFKVCGTLDLAVKQAYFDATQNAEQPENLASGHNPVILLSPGCASWDQFSSFEARGDAFKVLFQELSEKKI